MYSSKHLLMCTVHSQRLFNISVEAEISLAEAAFEIGLKVPKQMYINVTDVLSSWTQLSY